MNNENKIEGDYFQKPTETLEERYGKYVDAEGFIKISIFSIIEFRQRADAIVVLVHSEKERGEELNLFRGLNIKESSGDDLLVHKDDLNEFARRVKDYYGVSQEM